MRQAAATFNLDLPSPTLNRKMLITEAITSLPNARFTKDPKVHDTFIRKVLPVSVKFRSCKNALTNTANCKYFTKSLDKCILKEWPLTMSSEIVSINPLRTRRFLKLTLIACHCYWLRGKAIKLYMKTFA